MRNNLRLRAIWPVSALLAATVIIAVMGAHSVGVRAQAYNADPHGFFTDETDYCQLCHDVHSAPGSNLLSATVESEVCFTCHNGTGSIYNTWSQLNRDPANNAMHPITVDLANNPGVYQIVPNTTAGIAPPGPYACSQCHNPHGETGYASDLRAQYSVDEYVAYPASPDPYTFCWGCHDAAKIVDDEAFFKKHKEHIKSKSSPCTSCHYSPHGVPYGKLVNFNPAFVSPVAPNTNPIFTDLGPNQGSCTLTCHGKIHDNLSY